MTSTVNYHDEIVHVRQVMAPYKAFIKRPAKGALKHDYLVPSGYYQEQWDWDAFFMGVALSSEISSEAIFLKNWALNYIEFSSEDGFTPGCVRPEGAETGHRAFLMKPLIAQGTYLASTFLKDFSWVKPHYVQLKKMVLYREKNVWSKDYDLGMWTNSMESGADDNVASFNFPEKTVISTDVNAFLYREYAAMSKIAEELGEDNDSQWFATRAETLKENTNKYLWNKEDEIYYNLDTRTGKPIKRIAYSCFLPLWAKMAKQEQAAATIKRYLLEPTQMWTDYGIRSLSKQDPEYNNVNRIKPYSNWQGPIWPIANYLYMQGMLNYGFQKESIQVAQNIFKTVENGIKTVGSMRENYDAETGDPLAAPNFVSWNILIGNMLDEAVNKTNPFSI